MFVTKHPNQSAGEEIASSISHGIGFLAAIATIPILVVTAARRDDVPEIVGGAIFTATMVVLYLASTLCHAWPQTRTKQFLRIVDYGAIFLLIAGTYTPFTLGVLNGGWGWTLFGVVWELAVTGVILKIALGARYLRLSIAVYILMGWLVLITVKPLLTHVPAWGLFWLLAGGLAHTGGVFFYNAGHLRYSHFV